MKMAVCSVKCRLQHVSQRSDCSAAAAAAAAAKNFVKQLLSNFESVHSYSYWN
jgi:hypothetical protein